MTSSTGTFDYSGYLEVSHGDGTSTRHPFSSSYTVMEPTATVSATMMNVLYAGIDNPVSISVPGVPMNAVSAAMTNGTLTRKGDATGGPPLEDRRKLHRDSHRHNRRPAADGLIDFIPCAQTP